MRPNYRIPMPPKNTFVDCDDLMVGVSHRTGVGVSMVIAEDALPQIGAEAISHAVDNLGRLLVCKHLEERMQYVCNDAWVEKLVMAELKLTVREFVVALWTAQEKEDMWRMMQAIRKGGDPTP